MTTGTRIERVRDPSIAQNGAAVTPHDTNELNNYSRWLFFSATAAQTLRYTTVDGTVMNLTFGAAGTYFLPLAAKLVSSTGTTVTGIVAFW